MVFDISNPENPVPAYRNSELYAMSVHTQNDSVVVGTLKGFTVLRTPPTAYNQILRENGQISIDWTGGSLQQADFPHGPWVDVIDPQQPFPVSHDKIQQYFRVVK